jgi:hypothetical protein
MKNPLSVLLHGLAGIVIAGAPLLIAAIPLSWQALTVGAVLAMLLQWAKLYTMAE